MSKRFWSGFEKQALQDTKLKEDLAVAGTSLLPFGTTLHTAMSDTPDKGKTFLARIGGAIAGGVPGAVLGQAVGGNLGGNIGARLGGAAGEVAANRFMHGDKYDSKGNLKEQYRK